MNRRKNNLFKEVPVKRVAKNLFDLSHEVKMSGKFGFLYPVLVMDTLPGDTVRDQMTAFIRFAPMLAPIMHLIDVFTHFFFVPNRLLTDGWETFITGGTDGTETYVLPYVTPNQLFIEAGNMDPMAVGSLWDYLGLPIMSGPPLNPSEEAISVLPFRAYAKVFNDYYRDPNLPDTELELNVELAGEVTAETVDNILRNANTGPFGEGGVNYGLLRRGWEKDYFTAALPWAQRGVQVLLPLGGTGSVTYSDVSTVTDNDGDPVSNTDELLGTSGTGSPAGQLYGKSQVFAELGERQIRNIAGVTLDTSTITINDFRRTIAIQQWLENNARGGGRYIEQIQSHFNMRVPDFRLQRSEYLGGGKQPVRISEVLSTAQGEGEFVGDMSGHGISVGKSNRFTYRCQEHGWIIGILSVMPKTAYMQGLDRMWTRTDKYDFAWPELAHLGEQEIKSKEIFFSFDMDELVADEATFGYIPRYSEYKFRNDRVAGDFRTTLGFWHLTRNFIERPSLDLPFLNMIEDTGVTGEESFRRIFAVQDGTDYLWMQLFHRLTAKRPLPYFGVPMI